jgi:amidase
MKRLITFITISIILLGSVACDSLPASLTGGSDACGVNDGVYPKPEPDYNAKRARDLAPFEAALDAFPAARAAEMDALLKDKTILDIQVLFENGDLTSEELVTYYVDRIRRYDIDGLNSVMELNPQALEIAHALDEERAGGQVRGDIHGIPVLLKDNIAAAGGLHAAAGAAALQDWQPDRDAFLVKQLRDSGAIILGKANLSEWANWMDECMPNGFSALGGQTQNPYGPFDPLGSSSGSAVAAAANLSTVTVGSETQGSLILPSGINSVVGLKTSKGLVSGDYIIPLLPFQDVPGPIGRNVTDVAVLLTAMAGPNENDPATQNAAELADTDFTQYLAPEAAQGLRAGIVLIPESDIQAIRDNDAINDEQKQVLLDLWDGQNKKAREIGDALTAAGLEVVELESTAVPFQPDVVPLLTHGYKLAINEFLAGLEGQVSVNSLEEIVAFNKEDLTNRAPYGQDHLQASLASDMIDDEFVEMRDENIQATQEGLHKMFETYDIDLLAGNATQAYAAAGFPAITVPFGYDESGQPVAVIVIGDYLSEPQLIAAAYAYEQVTQARRDPDLEATMDLIAAMEK